MHAAHNASARVMNWHERVRANSFEVQADKIRLRLFELVVMLDHFPLTDLSFQQMAREFLRGHVCKGSILTQSWWLLTREQARERAKERQRESINSNALSVEQKTNLQRRGVSRASALHTSSNYSLTTLLDGAL